MFQRLPRLLCLLVLSFVAADAWAERLEPPSEVLRAPYVSIAATEFVEQAAFGHVVFRRIEQLAGKERAPELIDLIVGDDVRAQLKPGDRQLIAWTTVMGDPKIPEGLRRDPAGARLLVTAGLEPALFRDTSANRALVRWDLGESERRQRRQLPRLLALLDTPEAAVQNFAIAEIALRPVLIAALDDSARTRLHGFALDDGASTSARSLLLELVGQRADAMGGAGWEDVVEHILDRSPLIITAHPDLTHLVYQAFVLAQSRDMPLPHGRVERWLQSDNTALVEMALLALRRQGSGLEEPALERALARGDLPTETAAFLRDQQRRLQGKASKEK
jgi:hypothetical protein